MAIDSGDLVGGGGLPKLAPNLTYPADKPSSAEYIRITGIDCSSGLTTVLSLSGKYLIELLELSDLATENVLIKLTIDGVVIWNDTSANNNAVMPLLGGFHNVTDAISTVSEAISCESSLLLEVQTTADTSISIKYLVRPLL